MNDSEYTTCPYCGDAMPPRRRKHCGQLACKRAFNRERANRFTAAHPGYYSKYDTADCYEHVCPVCGKTFKNHKDKPGHCSVECWRVGQAEKQAEKQRQKRLPILHPGPYSWLPAHHPAMLMQQQQTRRLFIVGTCARCGRGFIVYALSGKATYCSVGCQGAAAKHTRRVRQRGVGRVPYRRIDIFERDGWRCHICARKTRRDVNPQHALAPSIDHLVPLAAGGRDAPENVACAHMLCNGIKSDTGAAQLILVASTLWG